VTRTLNQPLGGNEMPRFAGPATMMRLPLVSSAEGLDACFVGVPFDIGTSMRPGTRLGPRGIRAESAWIRPCNNATRAAPFQSLMVADVGDVPINTFSLEKSIGIIEAFFADILAAGCRPIAIGGDHTITLPILRAIKRRHGPVALVHVDAHADANPHHFGEPVTHGTTFRRAVEEGLLITHKVSQIGLRGSAWSAGEFDWPRAQGFRVVPAEAIWYKSLAPLMEEVCADVGDSPVYLTFDIDGLDPSCAPGTGALELGGLMLSQALEVIRGCRGLNLVGADLVEVSPPIDPSGNTCIIAANLLFEMLCVMPGVAAG
jgi:guanidinobutyrase